jgi:hypothetical protein
MSSGFDNTQHSSNITRLAWLLLALMTLIGAYLRAVSVMDTKVIQPLRADTRDYWVYAINLNYSGVYSRHAQRKNETQTPAPDAVRAPGYPVMLAAVMRVLPKKYWFSGTRWAQVVLGVLSILLTYLLFRALLPPLWDIIPAAFTATSPHLITMHTDLLSET